MFKSDLLKDRVIIITGGGTGLGLAMSRAMTRLGAIMAIGSRNPEHLDQAKKTLAEEGREPFVHPVDVRVPEQVETFIESVYQHFGRIDGLINNAAGNFLCPSAELTPNGFRTIVDIVLNGSFYCSLYAGQKMLEQKSGVILNIVTTYIETGSPYVLPSACAKAGVAAMTRSLAVEWGPYGIRVNAIAPGPIPTKGAWSRLMLDPAFEKAMLKGIPLRRVGKPEELAHVAVFLMSDLASYINGEIVFMDGGMWLRSGAMFANLEGFEDIMRAMRPRKK